MSSRSWTRSAHYAALAGALAWCVTAAACKGDDDDDAHDDHADADGATEDHDHDPNVKIGTPSGATCPDDGGMLSYDSFGKAFMDKYCVKCHSTELKGDARNGAPPDHDFNVYEGIIGVAMHVDQYAASGPDSTNKTMPPATDSGPKPTLEEREKLGEWLACELDMLE